ncbi:hypothetical protein ALC57_05253 [Trachymyrmex cornetzi]|uniref:Uncharacterized protein n=1 Tax=Trachymyrmex cornetzi TaxID=471704 RepID=A0A151JBE5_9HYME|nr:hypothetical protein ALC57_05253 [Trachymyrmex cornetzi]
MTDKINKLVKDRRGSTGELVKFLKRKREGEGGESGGGKVEETFRSSKKTIRSLVRMEKEGGMKELLREMRDEMGGMMMGIKKELYVEEGEKKEVKGLMGDEEGIKTVIGGILMQERKGREEG